MNSVRVRMACGLAMGVVLAAAGTVSGQAVRVVQAGETAEGVQPGGVTMKRSAREPKIERYARVLGLDEVQTEVARDLNVAYERTMGETRKAMNAAMKEAQTDMSDGDRAGFEEKMDKAIKANGDASKALTAQFLADLKSLLRADQQENWPRLERLRRRESLLGSMMGPGAGKLGGSQIDLIPLVGKLEVPAEVKPRVDELLGLYEVDIDRPLQDRERNVEEDRQTMGGIQQFTPESFQKMLDRDRGVDLRVREVNDKFVRLIAAELPEALNAKLNEEYRKGAYRSAYRSTSAGRELAAAEKLKGLSEKQREQVKAMNERYRRDVQAANDRLAAAMRRAEDEGRSLGGPMLMMGPGGSGEVDPQLAEARSQRRELDSKLREDMERLLSPEQLADAREAAKPQGLMGHSVSVVAHGMGGDEMVFVSDFEIDEDAIVDDGEGGEAIVIFRTVETGTPAQTEPEPK